MYVWDIQQFQFDYATGSSISYRMFNNNKFKKICKGNRPFGIH